MSALRPLCYKEHNYIPHYTHSLTWGEVRHGRERNLHYRANKTAVNIGANSSYFFHRNWVLVNYSCSYCSFVRCTCIYMEWGCIYYTVYPGRRQDRQLQYRPFVVDWSASCSLVCVWQIGWCLESSGLHLVPPFYSQFLQNTMPRNTCSAL